VRELLVEELLEVFYPLTAKVSSYSCPPLDGDGGSANHVGGGNPSADQTFVIDVSMVLDSFDMSVQRVLAVIYGKRLSLRRASMELRMGKSTVHRKKCEGIWKLGRELSRRKVHLTLRQLLKYT